MEMHFASIWEEISDLIPNEPVLICEENIKTWKEFDERSARLANFLESKSLKADSKVGLYLHNSNEYLEAQFSAFKIEGVPINVNYRYVEEELIYLLDNSDAEAVFFQSCYAERISKIANKLPKIKVFIQVGGDEQLSIENCYLFEDIIQETAPLDRRKRNEENIYMLYTGGTTGMPKGVMYKHNLFINSLLKTAASMGFDVPEEPEDIPKTIADLAKSGQLAKTIVACPLMHGTGMWLGAFVPLFAGGSCVTIPQLGFDPDLLLKKVENEKINNIIIVGDAFARPLLDSLNSAKENDNPYDLSSLRSIISSGVMWSAEVKEGLLNHADILLIDAMGSTEGGMGSSLASREAPAITAKFTINPGVIVITDDGREVEPGSNEMGKIGTKGLVPEGYYKDPKKSAETFKDFNGDRYSFPGDYALVEADGTIKLLGRGSNCINTAGEKVYPEEVEEALKRHPEIYDCLVVGIDDQKFGQKVVAVASRQNETLSQDDLINFSREHLSGYKLPKNILFVEKVERAPNGKANYKWAKSEAENYIKNL
jgi:fatty-acyl-CoA synthase|tara:strand:+ start:426 stop:2048 length:1623 start_codon:yes stop_codon:yes gene_type:complete